MSGTRIIAGELRGRLIPFSNREYGDADITPQKVKGAIFSMIGEWLHGRSFLDLYAGSGQIGLEAVSRGADPVVFNESDRCRFEFIKSYLDGIGVSPSPTVLNMTAKQAVCRLAAGKFLFDFIYLDPPYDKTGEGAYRYREIICMIAEKGILAGDGEIIVQHYSRNDLDEMVCRFARTALRRYGKTSLSVYRFSQP